MADKITITNNDPHSVAIEGEEFEDGAINFAGADTLVAGTIIARNTSTLKYQIYVKGGTTDGDGTPVGVLTYEVAVTASGDEQIRPLVKGTVKEERLVIDADGDNSNVDATVRDLLRQTGIVPVSTKQLGNYDNPAALGPGDS